MSCPVSCFLVWSRKGQRVFVKYLSRGRGEHGQISMERSFPSPTNKLATAMDAGGRAPAGFMVSWCYGFTQAEQRLGGGGLYSR